MSGYVWGVFIGAGFVLALSHIRWRIFPLSGGPVPLRVLGGPPEDALVMGYERGRTLPPLQPMEGWRQP